MSNENIVQVAVLRPFDGDEGPKWPGDSFTVSRQRFADLKANGLVEEVAEKQAAEHDNKQAPKPANKSAAKHETK